jgi:acyl-CoA thioesterase FadM
MGILVASIAFPAVTARMEVRYRSPAPTGVELDLAARIERVTGRQIFASATIDHEGKRLADAEGIFVQVPLRHFLRTEAGRALAGEFGLNRPGSDPGG